jgi:hypothetical protein
MSRVLYRERQPLRAADLQDEQDYLLGLAGRHFVGPHEWGIVEGLGLSVNSGLVTVAPGLAIDGYGRELVLAQPTGIELTGDAPTQYVYISYCQRPKGACGAAPNPRWSDAPAIGLTTELLGTPAPEGDPVVARAAGAVAAGAWYVLLGSVAKAAQKADRSSCRFTRLRGALVAAPSRQGLMRIGRETLADPYHFRIAVQTTAGSLGDRMAIDRDGNTSLWGNLIVTGISRSGTIATSIQGVSINVHAIMGAGADVRWRAISETIGGKKFVTYLFRSKDQRGRNVEDQLRLNADLKYVKDLNVALKNFAVNAQVVSLTRVGKVTVTRKKRSKTEATVDPPSNPPPPPILDDRELRLEYEGATVAFEPEPEGTAPEFCACAEDDGPGKLPEGLIFMAGTTPPSVTSRDIYAIRVSEPNQLPAEQLRICGGPFKKGDLGRRLSIGNQDITGSPSAFRPWFSVKGNGSIEIPGGKLGTDGKAFTMLIVSGTVEPPPLAPDPRDPLFNALSALAFINGVLSRSSSLLRLTLALPSFVETEQDWQYHLLLENLSTQTVRVTNTSEVIGAGTHSFLRAIDGITPIVPRGSLTVPINHLKTDIPIPAAVTELTLDLRIAMKANDITVGGSKVAKVPVIQSPQLNSSSIPASVPNSTLPQTYQISILNSSGQRVTINSAATSLGTIQLAQPLPLSLDPNAALQGTLTIPHQATPGTKTVSITINYQWTAAGPALTLTHSADVQIT